MPSKLRLGGDDGDALELLAERRQLGAREPERRVVDHVRDVRPVGPEHAVDVLDELPGA